MKNENENWGARIERGIIDEADGGKYKVKSLCREGVKTPWIKAIAIEPTLYADVSHDVNGAARNERIDVKYKPTEYKKDDIVYFFLFPDGHGAILGKAE